LHAFRDCLDRLKSGDPETEAHFTRYFRELLLIKLRSRLRSPAAVEDASACRSAGERTYAAEGLVGFAWAFLRAGAQRVIAGLWDVDDRSTAALMGRVYERPADGSSPGAALRSAKLEMTRSDTATAKPYYWAPFQLFVGAQVVP
jgi:CHAT domain-containing protein